MKALFTELSMLDFTIADYIVYGYVLVSILLGLIVIL